MDLNNKKRVIVTAPSLDPSQNVSGVSSVVNFIIDNNPDYEYVHFQLGKKDLDKGGIHRVSSILQSLRKWNRLINSISEEEKKSTIIHYSFPLSAPSILRDPVFMWMARRKGIRMVVHVHGGLFLTAAKTPWLLERILKWVFSWDIPFIVLSGKEKDLVFERYQAKHIEILPNCIDLKDASFFERMVNKDAPLVMGFLGRIEPKKGMSELLEACKMLNKDGVPYMLKLAGKEERKDEYIPLFEQACGDKFEYCGLVSGKKKTEFLKSLDIFIMPSYFEGLPMSLLECMSFSSVPIITPVGSVPVIVTPGENGMFVSIKDVDTIVDAVKRMHTDRELLEVMAKKAKSTIFDNFSSRKYIDKLNSIYFGL